jgi:cytochrome c peroxidase
MQVRYSILLVVVAVLAIACSPAEDGGQAAQAPQAAPSINDLWEQANLRFNPIPASADNPDNPLTDAKIALGKALYYDTRLSEDGTISCNSCHDLATFGVDNEPTSDGVGGQVGDRNSPTVLNAAFHQSQFWDGRAKDVEEQAGMPILNPVEMAIPSKEFLVDRLSATEDYPPMFAAAFPDENEPLTYRNIEKALGAFERTLITPSRFDAYLEGDQEALDEQELAGLQKFMDLNCTTCHNGVNLGAHTFQKFGLMEDYWVHTESEKVDEGRFAVTQDENDKFVFRVASLRNVAETRPYFHDGSVETLEDAIRVMVKVQLALDVSDEEIESMAAFLRTLSGEVPAAALQTEGENAHEPR